MLPAGMDKWTCSFSVLADPVIDFTIDAFSFDARLLPGVNRLEIQTTEGIVEFNFKFHP